MLQIFGKVKKNMTKKFFRGLTLGVIVFSIACLAGYLVYVGVYYSQGKNSAEVFNNSNWVNAVQTDSKATPQENVKYIARLENNDIAIYLSGKDGETYMYSLNVYINDIPPSDLIRLSEGIILNSADELTSFEEDFTS